MKVSARRKKKKKGITLSKSARRRERGIQSEYKTLHLKYAVMTGVHHWMANTLSHGESHRQSSQRGEAVYSYSFPYFYLIYAYVDKEAFI